MFTFPEYTVPSVTHSTLQQWGPQVSLDAPLNPFPMGEATIPPDAKNHSLAPGADSFKSIQHRVGLDAP